MKKIILIILFLLPFLSKGQYADFGVKISKFNSGIQSKIAIGGASARGDSPWGIEGSITRSLIANYGYLVNGSLFKNWCLEKILNTDELFIVTKTGVNIGTYKDFYYVNQNYTGNIFYVNGYTSNFGLTAHVGVEWVSSILPITIEATVNPWYDIINKGPEVVDYSFTIKYQMVSFY